MDIGRFLLTWYTDSFFVVILESRRLIRDPCSKRYQNWIPASAGMTAESAGPAKNDVGSTAKKVYAPIIIASLKPIT